jgi:hypothetical protein
MPRDKRGRSLKGKGREMTAEGSPIVSWIYELVGRPHDLLNWASCFAGGDFRVEVEHFNDRPPRYYLHTSRFDGISDIEIRGVAADIITWMNGVAKIWYGINEPVIMGLPITVREDGSRVPVVEVERVERLQIETLTNLGAGSIRPAPVPAGTWVVLAAVNPQVADAAKYFAEPDSWHSFYKIYEAVCKAVGGQKALLGKKWLSESVLNDLRQTANFYRHAAERPPKHTLPKRPPSLYEARSQLRTILQCWLWELASPDASV